MVISLLFLGLTLYLLQRPPAPEDSAAARWFRWTNGRAWLLLPPLFLLWANLDSWFLLGPLTVFLYLGAEALQGSVSPGQSAEPTPQPQDLRILACVALIGLVVCLLNPHHVGVFTTLPPELAAFGLNEDVRNDIGFKIYYPFGELAHLVQDGESDFFTAGEANNIAGWSYFALLLLGLVSFVLNLEGWTWWRALIWLAFAVLSACQARAIPFFAVVAGPITALNLQDFAVRRFGTVSRTENYWPLWLLGGRGLTLLAGVLLLLAAWPGWLNARFDNPRSPHRVAWAVEPDPSLKTAAEELRSLRQRGELGESDHGFNFSPEVADYWAWFCPEEKGFFDRRFQLSPEMAQTYVSVRHALPKLSRGGEVGDQPIVWHKVFETHHIRYLVLNKSDKDAQSVALSLGVEQSERRNWVLVHPPFDGQTFTLVWNPDPEKPSPLTKSRLDMQQLAFGKAAQPLGEPSQPPRAPERGEWYEHFWKAAAPRPAGADEAAWYLTSYGIIAQEWTKQWNDELATAQKKTDAKAEPIGLAWSVMHRIGYAATGQGTASLWLDYRARPLAEYVVRGMVPVIPPTNLPSEPPGFGPPAAVLLAVRAARRAIDVNPDDPDAYLHLSQAYAVLLAQEDAWSNRRVLDRKRGIRETTPRSLLREMQQAAALQHFLTLTPDHHTAHALLGLIFRQRGFLDMEMDQYREALKYLEEALPGQSESAQARSKQLVDNYKKLINELDPDLQKRKDIYVTEAKNQPARIKFLQASRLGLAQEALNILERIDPTELKEDERQVLTGSLLELYLLTGQVDKAREIKTSSDRFLYFIAAVEGNYPAAAKHFDAWLKKQQHDRLNDLAFRLRQQAFGGREGVRVANIGGLVVNVFELRDLAEHHALRGILALEQGDIKAAKAHFEEAQKFGYPWKTRYGLTVTPFAGPLPLAAGALETWHKPRRSYYQSEPVAKRYLQLLREQE
jgi:tetratricopeptide (TPR) repeat protein